MSTIRESVYLPYYITIPKNTTKEIKLKSSREISGRVTKVIINIPDGWDITSGLRFELGSQVMPMIDNNDSSEYFSGNNIPLELKPNIELKEDSIKIYGINDDGINDHSCFVTFEISTDKEITP